MTLTTTLTERAAGFLDNRTSRRGFLTRTALVGSAVTTAGVTYATRPASAYVTLCNGRLCDSSDLCCDGYTEFCCQLYGDNSCPPDTILAGWWKVDNSDFCAGAARYYMDCNKAAPSCSCSGSWPSSGSGVCRDGSVDCQCRSCGNRKDGCTAFRYGNCNNDVACVGQIMCRVVTCAKPWEIDPGCSTVARTDENTRWHNRACLAEATPNEAFVMALYRDYLDRDHDDAGLAYWTGRLGDYEGRPQQAREFVSRSFAYSQEYMQKVVTGWYRLGLERDPDRGGLDHWVGRMQSGTKPSVIAGFIFSSDEFYRRSGSTDPGFVRRLYRKLLDRDATAREVVEWTGRMARGTTRREVAYAVFQMLESRRKRVTTLYQRFLKRNTDPSGRDYWSERILDEEDVALSVFISASEEYLGKAIEAFR